MQKYITKNALPQVTDFKHPVHAMVKFRPASAIELAAIGSDLPDGYVAGWASTPDLDLYRHVVVTGAFSESITARGISGPKGIKFLVGHDWDKVAGVIKVLEYRGDSLWIEAQFNLAISYAKDAYEACKMNGGLNFSVGFMLDSYAYKKDDDEDEYLVITKGDLFEVSVVPFPGNEEATMLYVKNREQDSPKTIAELEKYLVTSDFVKCRNDAKRVTLVVKQYFALLQKDKPKDIVSAPMLDIQKINEASELVAKLKSLLATNKSST